MQAHAPQMGRPQQAEGRLRRQPRAVAEGPSVMRLQLAAEGPSVWQLPQAAEAPSVLRLQLGEDWPGREPAEEDRLRPTKPLPRGGCFDANHGNFCQPRQFFILDKRWIRIADR